MTITTHKSKSIEDTKKAAYEFSKKLQKGDVIFLHGQLGAGKTYFVAEVARAFGVKTRTNSPTFTISRTHKTKGGLLLHHVDLYRLETEKEIENAGVYDIINNNDGIVFVEWAEKMDGFSLPTFDINIEVISDTEREITIIKCTNFSDAIEMFKKGKIGIFPTDTAFGVGCRIDDKDSVKQLFKIRSRPENKPILALADSFGMVKKYVEVSDEILEKLAKKYWPGELTIVLPCKKNLVPDLVRAGGETLAVRIPNSKKLRDLIAKVGIPILAPSANLSGRKTPFIFTELDKNLLCLVDFIVYGSSKIRKESTIIDCFKKPWRILRRGAIEVIL